MGAIARRVQSLRLGGRTGLTVEVEAGAVAWAHDDLLERVIAHLVQNGFDASDGEQDVHVRVERVGDEVLVEVTDQGKGMTPEFIRERLFKPFQTTKDTGMGIGVFECQQYVQQVGGRIDVQSAPGEGHAGPRPAARRRPRSRRHREPRHDRRPPSRCWSSRTIPRCRRR